MTLQDLFHETTSALLANKVRSGLTVLGIVIGIASVIAMLAIGAGASGSIQSSIQSIGSNLVIVMPGAQRGPGTEVSAGRGSSETLTADDATAIAQNVTDVAAVAPNISTREQVVAPGTNTNTSVIGTVAAYAAVRDVTIADGSFITDQQNQDLARVAVLGPTTRDDLFGAGASVVGKSIRIKGIDFKIIGVTVPKGGSGFNNVDDTIYIPLMVAQRFLVGGTYVSTISVEATSASAMQDVQNQITTLLLERHHITNAANADFSVLNQQDILSAASSVTNTLTILLASVAGISLLVGGIGIMNMMLTTVTERMREIGLRRAIGAKKSDINVQFLVEAVLLTLVGGIIGIGLGWGISYTISALNIMQASMSFMSIVLAFGVSAIIGVVFGYYPARRASRLHPIEALRYE